jgi:hypothetical protein
MMPREIKIKIIIIQFFIYLHAGSEVNYKVSTSEETRKQTHIHNQNTNRRVRISFAQQRFSHVNHDEVSRNMYI